MKGKNPPPFIILASENDIRVQLFQQALQQQGLSKATLISYQEFIHSPDILGVSLKKAFETTQEHHTKQHTCILRIDSPGRDLSVHADILMAGISHKKQQRQSYVSKQDILLNMQDKGRVIAPDQYYAGFCHILNHIQNQLIKYPHVSVMNPPKDILLAFDKYQCQQFLFAHGISIPTPLEQITSYEHLRESMKKQKIPRVFIKLKHGSSASGIIAFETAGDRVQIKTTLESVKAKDGELTLYNSRKIQRSKDEKHIKQLIDKLCKMQVQVERWIPKAQIKGFNVDLRILMIAGKAHHKVLRMSHSPITNLHLLNKRGDVDLIREKMSKQAWSAMIKSCEKVAKLFPKSLYLALDVAVSINFKQHYILEVNAFGDLLKGVTYKGLSPQEAEISHLISSS